MDSAAKALSRNRRYLPVTSILLGCLMALLVHTQGYADLDLRSHSQRIWSNVATAQYGADNEIFTCSRQPAIDRLIHDWGLDAMRMGQAYTGSGSRVRSFLRKLQRGEAISLGVFGGSITAGHGLKRPEEKVWAEMLFDWIQDTYPHANHTFQNGAIPATGTDYFAFCFERHISKHSDLIVVEEAVNDAYVDQLANADAGVDTTDYAEWLSRVILGVSPSNTLMMLSSFKPDFWYINGAEKHSPVSTYYDIPRISSKPYLYKYLASNPDQATLFYDDGGYGHPYELGHRYMADLLIYHFETALCHMEAEAAAGSPPSGTRWHRSLDLLALPQMRIHQRMWTESVPEPKTFCSSTNMGSETGELWGLMPSKNVGFYPLQYNDKSWWAADEAGSTITFDDVEVNGGTVGIYYYRAGNEGLGNLFCWVDDDKVMGKKLKGPWFYGNVGSYGHISSVIPQGKHSVTCEVMEHTDDAKGSHHARIIAIMST